MDELASSGLAIQGVVIATPASTHEAIALAAIAHSWDVLVEKPAAMSLAGVRRIRDAAHASNRIFAVGHLLLHHLHVQKARELIAAGRIGKPLYLYGQRLNLGKVRTDEDVISSLAPHDFSIVHFLLGLPAIAARVWPLTVIDKPRPLCDVAFVSLQYEGGLLGQFHFSWLDPFKRRELVVVGDQGMLVFDDMSPDQKLRIYDKSVAPRDAQDFHEFNQAIEVRDRGCEVPEVPNLEPMAFQTANFIDCITTRNTPLAGSASAIAVAEAMELVRSAMPTSS
jgi:predicted dehydrogenase